MSYIVNYAVPNKQRNIYGHNTTIWTNKGFVDNPSVSSPLL